METLTRMKESKHRQNKSPSACDAGRANYAAITQSKKGKGFPYSLPSVGPGADPGVQAVSPQVT